MIYFIIWKLLFLNFSLLIFRELGACVELLTPDMIKEKYPWLNVDDIELGSFGSLNSGWY
jgi:uncharacterized membrane protein YwaF